MFQLREQMLSTMTAVLKNVPNNTPQEVQLTARAVAGITKRREEVNSAAQVHLDIRARQHNLFQTFIAEREQRFSSQWSMLCCGSFPARS